MYWSSDIKPGGWAVMYWSSDIKPGGWAVMYFSVEVIGVVSFYDFSIRF
jgi:hypothetical protein